MKFTKPAIAALELPPGKADQIWFDDAVAGFGVRFRSGGKRTWIVQYRHHGRQRRLTLGRLDSLTLERAREAAKLALAQVGLGGDPQGDKARAKVDGAVTLASVATRYLAAAEKRLRPRSYQEASFNLTKAWSPLARLSMREIDRATVAARLATMTAENGPSASDHARTYLSALFVWAMREGIVDANPVILTNRPAMPRKRDRVLTDAELAEVWRAADSAAPYGRIVRLLILTGARRDEVGGMVRSEIDLEGEAWLIPGERTKNHRPHLVPLADPAIELVHAALADAGESLFGRRRPEAAESGPAGFSGWSKAKRQIDARINAARKARDAKAKPMPAWRLHDLRRTFSTRANEIGVAPHIVEAALNHISGAKAGVAGNYNFAVYAREKRAAMILWADHVQALVGKPSTVTPMKRKGAAA